MKLLTELLQLSEDWGSSDWFPVMKSMDEIIDSQFDGARTKKNIASAAEEVAPRWYEDMGHDTEEDAAQQIAYIYALRRKALLWDDNKDKVNEGMYVVEDTPAETAGREMRDALTGVGSKLRMHTIKADDLKKIKDNGAGGYEAAWRIWGQDPDKAPAKFKAFVADVARMHKNVELDAQVSDARGLFFKLTVSAKHKGLNEGMYVVKNKDGKEKRFKDSYSPEAEAWKKSSSPKAKETAPKFSQRYWELKDADFDYEGLVPWSKIADHEIADQFEGIAKHEGLGQIDDWYPQGKQEYSSNDGVTIRVVPIRMTFSFGKEDDLGLDIKDGERVSDAQYITLARDTKNPKKLVFAGYGY